MSFWDAVSLGQGDNAIGWSILALVIGLIVIAVKIVTAVRDVKEAKYKAFSSYGERIQDMAGFYNWLCANEKLEYYLDATVLAKEYLNATTSTVKNGSAND